MKFLHCRAQIVICHTGGLDHQISDFGNVERALARPRRGIDDEYVIVEGSFDRVRGSRERLNLQSRLDAVD
jgi:hypothetical protein